jgi:hypothetical protein
MRASIAGIIAAAWAGVAGAAPFNPSRYEPVTATNHAAVGYLAWHVGLDNDHLIATGQGPTNQDSAFVLKRHLGGADKWNVVAALDGLGTAPDRAKVAIAGDLAVVGDSRHDGAALNAGAVHILLRNHGGADAWGWWMTLYPPVPVTNGAFGVNVATDGRYLAVASSTTNGVYLYARNAGGADQWGLVKTFVSAVTSDFANLSVAVGDDLLAVGDFWNPSNQVVRVYERDVGGVEQWGLQRTVSPADGQSTNDFGYAVALRGRLLAVGARRDASGDGAVYLFERDQGGSNNWGQVTKRLPDAGLDGRLGSSVTVDGDTVVAAAPNESGLNPPDGGALYVFQRNAGGSNAWGRTARLLADDGTRYLGSTRPGGLAVNGELIVAGNYWQDSLSGSGGARVFREYACPDWTLLKRVVATSAGTNNEFGLALAFDDSLLVAGRPGSTLGGATASGGVVNFGRNAAGADNWGDLSIASSTITNHRYGSALAIRSGMVVVGAPGGSGSGNINIMTIINSGAEYFLRARSAPDNQPGEQFGAAVAIWDDTILAGSPLNNVAGTAAGAAFIFSRNQSGSNAWGLVKRLAPSPLPATAEFGRTAALYRDLAAVGAPYEEDFVNGLGAVYVFQANRGGSNNWGQVKRIKMPGPDAPYLGWSLALWGDVLAVGAVGDDEGALDSGAVYLFERDRGGADNWGLVKKVKSPTPQDTAGFGWSVALRGDRLVVGEPRRDADFLDQGRAFVFERNQDGTDQWGYVTRIDSTVPQTQAWFGASVALINDRIAVGAPFEDIGTATNAGAVYLFQPDCLRITTTNDVVSSGDGLTSLREAISLANASTQAAFAVDIPDGTFPVTISSSLAITNTTSEITLRGQGARRTILDRAGNGRALHLEAGTTGDVRGLTIKNALMPAGNNGAGTTNGGDGFAGAGIFNDGNWRIIECAIVSNAAGNGGNAQVGQGTRVGAGGQGGGIYNTGTLTIRQCTIAHNRAGNAGATGDVGNVGGNGGAIFCGNPGEVTILNSTLFGNSAGEGSAATNDGSGGAIYSFGQVILRHSTISHNNAGSGANRGEGGGIHLHPAFPATFNFSILNNNNGASSAPDGRAQLASPSYNLISDTNGLSFTGSPVSNIVGVLAQLGGSPGNYGGQTDTMLPQPGSPVIDRGDAAFGSPLASDQRGFLRPTNGITIDLGAVETTTDFDGDGVPDDWELARGTDREEPADAAADLDGDGLTGVQEYIMDADPYGSAPLAVVQIVQTGVTAQLQVPSSAARLYSLQTTLSLTGGTWAPIPTQQDVPGNGGLLTLVHTNAAPARGYRIVVEVP